MNLRRSQSLRVPAARPVRVSAGAERPVRLNPILRLRGFLGRHLSVRAKLTIWYGLMCAITLSLAGAAMSVYLNSRFQHDIDSSLVRTSALVRHQLSLPLPNPHRVLDQYTYCTPGKRPGPGAPPATRLYLSQLAVRYCLLIGRTLATQSSLLSQPGQFEAVVLGFPNGSAHTFFPPGRALPPIPQTQGPFTTLLNVGSGQQAQFEDIPNFRGESFRVYLTPLDQPAQLRHASLGLQPGVFRGLLAVYQDEHTYQQIRSEFNFVLLLGIPLGVLIALVAGWWIARAALRPLDRFSRTVRAIGESRDLRRRLDFVGPDDEVGRLAETFDGMMDRLERVFETQKRFIQDASHELRTPLTAIRGNADLMVIAPPDEREICLTAIRQEAQRMSRLVTDLLLLAEADVAEHPLQMRDVDLDELVADVYRSGLVLAGDRVTVSLERVEPLCIEGDADRLKQLLLNLVDNAVKFTPEGGVVAIRLYRDDDDAVIQVADTGVGIPAADQEAIFQRFYRVEASRAKRGSGLGLAISAWIVQAHGGTISVNSQPEKGSTFTVRLPLAGTRPTAEELHPPTTA